MTKILIEDRRPKNTTIPMYALKNGEFAVITDDAYPQHNDHLVMRTLSETCFEIMDLTKGSPGACWSYDARVAIPKTAINFKVTVINAVTITIGGAE